ncbi:hypothetical protein OH76DRAFT_1490821 [Lentinus brumalis]|uniref:Uncharacterized protein n=1 Tax=Lentinus brumalis TaxID=2498619 RepID=A0A371CHR2_9APHY|nr:hypothetical protein OH76DRAFT_1490821 [Polyporus brumalis]
MACRQALRFVSHPLSSDPYSHPAPSHHDFAAQRAVRQPLRFVSHPLSSAPEQQAPSHRVRHHDSDTQHPARRPLRFVSHPLSFEPYPRHASARPVLGPPDNSYSSKPGAERGWLRSLLDEAIAEQTGVGDAKMQWTVMSFCEKVFLRFGIKLVGWPPHIPFQNLSDGPVTVDDIRELIGLCERDSARPSEPAKLRFVAATPEELRAARSDATRACPGPLFPPASPSHGYDNIGRRALRLDEDGRPTQPRYERNGPKSAKVISDEEDGEPSVNVAEEDLPPMVTQWGVRMLWCHGVWRYIGEGELSD